jgi:hypothetical protein
MADQRQYDTVSTPAEDQEAGKNPYQIEADGTNDISADKPERPTFRQAFYESIRLDRRANVEFMILMIYVIAMQTIVHQIVQNKYGKLQGWKAFPYFMFLELIGCILVLLAMGFTVAIYELIRKSNVGQATDGELTSSTMTEETQLNSSQA